MNRQHKQLCWGLFSRCRGILQKIFEPIGQWIEAFLAYRRLRASCQALGLPDNIPIFDGCVEKYNLLLTYGFQPDATGWKREVGNAWYRQFTVSFDARDIRLVEFESLKRTLAHEAEMAIVHQARGMLSHWMSVES